MPEFSFTGSFSAATAAVPDVYLNIQPPNSGAIAPALTGLMGLVGVASFGPVAVPTPYNSQTQPLFGNPTVRLNDLVTHATITLQAQQAASSGALQVVRATDGTDTAAAVVLNNASAAVIATPGTGYAVNDTVTLVNGVVVKVSTIGANGAITAVTVTAAGMYPTPAGAVAQGATSGVGVGATFTLTSVQALSLTLRYTGSTGNGATWAVAQGSSYTPTNPTWRLILTVPGFASEVFDNIGGTGNALFLAMASAVNNGNNALRGPSLVWIASAGTSTISSISPNSGAPSGGTDGASNVTSAVLVGVDTPGARTGVYAFRNSGASHLVVADLADTTQEANLSAFGQGEGILVHTSGPAGETVATGATNKQNAGTNNVFLKRWLGDWTYWADNFNGVQRLTAPATFGAAMQSTLQPQQSGLNKPVTGVVATQRSRLGTKYGQDELTTLVQNSIDVICNPIPAGAQFGCRVGKTSSSDGTRNTDNWPVLTNFLARSIAGPGALGSLIGQDITPDFFTTGYDMLDGFLSNLQSPGNGLAPVIENYQINFGPGNNPQAQTATGVVVAQIWVEFFGIAATFLVNMQTGATVVIPGTASGLNNPA